jgi:hypothetical protein
MKERVAAIGDCPADLWSEGAVNGIDLGLLLGAWD